MSDLIKWNQSDMDEEPVQELDPSMVPSDPEGYVPVAPEVSAEDEFIESLAQSEEEEEQDDAEILSNARLRLEQGRLYEMLMTADVFQNLDADEQAMKNVQRELKRFAKERMEVMLGMRQEKLAQQYAEYNAALSVCQFNSLEVDVLKSLAKKLSGGETEKVVPIKSGLEKPPKNTTLTPISSNSSKTKVALKNAVNKQVSKKVVPVKEQESSKPIDKMTFDEKLEHARKREVEYKAKKATNPQAIPMPSYDALNAAHMTKAAKFNTGIPALNTIAANLLKG